MRERLLWILAGAAGLVLAAGVGLAASELTRAPVGLSAEPVSAGEALAPKPRRTARPRRTQTPTPTPTATATADSDDHGGDDSHGRGRSDDDD